MYIIDRMSDGSLILQASAGSGKTYRLATRFLYILDSLLNKISVKDPNFQDFYKILGSIIAITFTNKAASEMQQRIMSFLDDISFDRIAVSDIKLSREDALTILFGLIKNHSYFNLTTIDSFMNKILRALAIDLKIKPDYDIFFDQENIFDLAIEDIISDKKNESLLLDFIESMLELNKVGFNPQKIISLSLNDFSKVNIDKDVINFNDFIIYLNEKLGINAKNYIQVKDVIKKKLIDISEEFSQIKNSNEDIFDKRKNLFSDKIEISEISKIEKSLKNISSISKTPSCLIKSKKSLNKQTEESIRLLADKAFDLFKCFLLATSIYKTDSILKVLKILFEAQGKIREYLNIVEIGSIAANISKILIKQGILTQAFCNLGQSLNYFLIDEFQDTSVEQFEAMAPLIENALSEGGSLFIVGDKKQAIYGWRGGDYNLFSRPIFSQFDVAKENLGRNYRSSKTVVDFNNNIFDLNNLIESYKEFILDEDEVSNLIIQDIKLVYENSKQVNMNEGVGYIETRFKVCQDEDEINDFVRTKLIVTLKTLIYDKNIKPKEIMILLRTKKEIEKVINWLSEDLREISFVTQEAGLISKNFEIKKLLLLLKFVAFKDDPYKRMLEEVGIPEDIVLNVENKSSSLSVYELVCYILEQNFLDTFSSSIFFERVMEIILRLSLEQKSLIDIIDYLEKEAEIGLISEDVDCLKVITIHKSKGLESHTVIIPFYNWTLYNSRIDDIKEVELDGFKMLVKISDVRALNANDYNEAIRKQFIENLNLMYVANTRAKENLFIIAARYLNKSGAESKEIYASNFLFNILKTIYNEPDNLNLGYLKAYNDKVEINSQVEDYRMQNWPSMDIKKHLKIYNSDLGVQLNFEDRLFGNLFHLAMSYIDSIEKNILDEIIEKAYLRASNVLRYSNIKIKDLMKTTILSLSDYFCDIQNFYNERDFVDRNGNVLRIDRIVKKHNKLFIIDYKTGNFTQSHVNQIKTYTKLFDNAKGILYYVIKKETIYVN